MIEVSVNGVRKEIERVAFLLATGLDHCEHGFNEAASGFALCSEAELLPDDRMT